MSEIMPPPRIMIVEARFYEEIADEMVAGAIAALELANAEFERFPVPGAFEIPAAVKFAVKSMEIDETRQPLMDTLHSDALSGVRRRTTMCRARRA